MMKSMQIGPSTSLIHKIIGSFPLTVRKYQYIRILLILIIVYCYERLLIHFSGFPAFLRPILVRVLLVDPKQPNSDP